MAAVATGRSVHTSEPLGQRRRAWVLIAELHRRTVRFCGRAEEARDRAIDLSLLDDMQFEYVVDVLTALCVNISIATVALAGLRVQLAADGSGISSDPRPAPHRKAPEPAVGEEEHHARQRMIVFRRTALLFHRRLAATSLQVAVLSEDVAQLTPLLPVLTAVAVNIRNAADTIGSLAPPAGGERAG